MWAEFTGLPYFYPFSPLLLPFHILFIEISLSQLIHLCSSAMHKNLLTELASKPANTAMRICKGEASQYNSERQVNTKDRSSKKC